LSSPLGLNFLGANKFQLTLEERGRKIGTHVPIPLPAPPRDRVRDGGDVHLLKALQDAVARAEPNDDAGDAQQEGLDPELEELALKVVAVAVVANLGRRLELDPVDGVAGLWGLGVPDCARGEKKNRIG
jgi:hypothetical protein